MGLTIVGLGPGDEQQLTRQAWDILSGADKIYLRTERHPVVEKLPKQDTYESFDSIYESAADFGQVYEEIVAQILDSARQADENGSTVVYAVPGHPLVGESTVSAIIAVAQAEGLPVKIVPGLSFVEPTLTALGVDALDGLQLFDAIEIAQYNHPPINSDIPLLLGQVYSKLLANELKLALMALYPDEHEVVLIHEAGMASQLKEEIPLYAIDRSQRLAHMTSLYVPPLPYASALPALADTVAHLRGPGGCPWDQEQTHQSMRDDFLEEASEVLDALDDEDPQALCEELGDMLYHLVMQAQIASESGEFQLGDVIAGIDSKLKRRHPHVWGDWQVEDTAEVVRNWEALKEREKARESGVASLVDNIPYSLPALARAQKIQEQVKRVGFDWPELGGVLDKIEEEIAELKAASNPVERRQELGDLIFAIVNWGRWMDINAEIALREANRRFDRRFRQLEQIAIDRGQKLDELDLGALDAMWEEAKTLTYSADHSPILGGHQDSDRINQNVSHGRWEADE
jgi:tetrapyrrole methylase family protein/MazG family protein